MQTFPQCNFKFIYLPCLNTTHTQLGALPDRQSQKKKRKKERKKKRKKERNRQTNKQIKKE
jgi:hypothetical protein